MRKTAALVLGEVAAKHQMTVAQLVSPARAYCYSHPRQEAMYQVFIECPHLSLPDIGKRIGHRDHTTILHGIRRHAERLGTSYENAKRIRAGRKEGREVRLWVRSTVTPDNAAEYRQAASIQTVTTI